MPQGVSNGGGGARSQAVLGGHTGWRGVSSESPPHRGRGHTLFVPSGTLQKMGVGPRRPSLRGHLYSRAAAPSLGASPASALQLRDGPTYVHNRDPPQKVLRRVSYETLRLIICAPWGAVVIRRYMDFSGKVRGWLRAACIHRAFRRTVRGCALIGGRPVSRQERGGRGLGRASPVSEIPDGSGQSLGHPRCCSCRSAGSGQHEVKQMHGHGVVRKIARGAEHEAQLLGNLDF